MKPNIEKIKLKIEGLLKEYGVVRAGIFGSYARGEEKKASDIDILVEIKNPEMSLLDFIKLKHKIEELLKIKVDLVEYDAVKPLVKERIFNEEVKII